jgi:hypothetical protein
MVARGLGGVQQEGVGEDRTPYERQRVTVAEAAELLGISAESEGCVYAVARSTPSDKRAPYTCYWPPTKHNTLPTRLLTARTF